MYTNDILLAAVLDSSNLPPAKSFIDNCCTNNVKFTQTYDENIYDNGVIPSKHLVIICCMDARLDIFRMLGLQPGEAHIIRNGGGRIRDAVRSLICSQTLFRTKELMIIHHTDCGFTYFSSNDQILASLMRRQSLTLDISPIGTTQIGVRSSSKIRPLNDDKFSSATTFDHHSLPRKRSSKRSSIVTHSLNLSQPYQQHHRQVRQLPQPRQPRQPPQPRQARQLLQARQLPQARQARQPPQQVR
ncbi:unnamed protein product [Rotaria sordida]|uniref:Carbonic anhydrase n=1 Tax=Rotaria sordida TaxID=392033 RepID=A0A819N196_9BILA|nr:unnamed protein product [Rotaria sordida]